MNDSESFPSYQDNDLASYLKEDLVVPPRPRSTEPRFDSYTRDAVALQPKLTATSKGPSAAPTKVVGRVVPGPAKPPPPIYSPDEDDDMEEDGLSSSRPSSRSSSRPPSVLKQPLLQDVEGSAIEGDDEKKPIGDENVSNFPQLRRDPSPTFQLERILPPSSPNWEEHPHPSNTTIDQGDVDNKTRSTVMGQVLDEASFFSIAEDKGVEVELTPHLSALGFGALKARAAEKIATASLPSRPSNVSTFDRSASIMYKEAFGGFNSHVQSGSAIFTPPNVRTKVSLAPPCCRVSFSRGTENAPPLKPDSSAAMPSVPISSPGLPQAPLVQQLPNISSFGRSASMGGHLLGISPDASDCRTPANQDQSSHEGTANKVDTIPRQLPYRPREPSVSRGPLPSLPLASPKEEDDDEDTYEYTSPPGKPTGPFVAFNHNS